MGSSSAVVVRVQHPRARVWETTLPVDVGSVLLLDLAGDYLDVDLTQALRSIDGVFDADLLLLRGVSQTIAEELAGTPPVSLRDVFPKYTRCVQVRASAATMELHQLEGDAPAVDEGVLLSLAAQLDIEASLGWSEAIWKGDGLHFVLPSGEHSDTFVRLGDALADPISASRIADWCRPPSTRNILFVADSPSIMPLAQELALRAMRDRRAESRILILPLYSFTEDEARDQLAQHLPWCRDTNADICALMSVSASGQSHQRLLGLCDELSVVHPPLEVVVCEASSEPSGRARCHLLVERYADASRCKLCAEGTSPPTLIDARRFTPLFIESDKLAELPRMDEMSEHAVLIEEADANKAIRVHTDRLGQGRHLGIFLDTIQLLQGSIFLAKARLALARIQHRYNCDLAIVPEHEATEALVGWLNSQGVDPIIRVPLRGELGSEALDRIRNAERILICDDSIVSSRTLRATLQFVQDYRQGTKDFKTRALVLVSRTEEDATLLGVRKRFFIDRQDCFAAAWTLNLPEQIRSNECPWCQERRWLEGRRVGTVGPVAYTEERLARLSDGGGLSERLFFGSEILERPLEQLSATGMTGNSYMGPLSDAGAYLYMSLLMQRIRTKWRETHPRHSSRVPIKLAQLIRQYTDPAALASILRAVRPTDIVPTADNDVAAAMREISFDTQHPVLLAEMILAIRRGRVGRLVSDAEAMSILRGRTDGRLGELTSLLDR